MRAQRDILLLIEDIYGTVGDDGRWPGVLRSLRADLDAAACALVDHDFEARAGAIRSAAGIAEPYLAAYRDRYAGLSPWLRREAYFRREGAVWTGQDLAPRRELAASEFYRAWLRPQGLLHQGCAVLRCEGPDATFVQVLRAPEAGAFDRRGLELLDVVAPHLRQALELSRLLRGNAGRRPRDLRGAVADAPAAMMVVGEGERLLAASGDAERLLATRDAPFRARRGHLRLAPAGGDGAVFHRHVESALRTASGEGVAPGGELPLPGAGGASAAARVLPLPSGALPGQDRPAVAVVVDDRVPSDDRLRELYGLTRAEARVAGHLARGLSVQEIAERLNVGLTTARTHLQRIYDKTDTHRQSELVALILGAAKRDGEG